MFLAALLAGALAHADIPDVRDRLSPDQKTTVAAFQTTLDRTLLLYHQQRIYEERSSGGCRRYDLFGHEGYVPYSNSSTETDFYDTVYFWCFDDFGAHTTRREALEFHCVDAQSLCSVKKP